MSKIVIGNWKMNGLKSAASAFRSLISGYSAECAAKVQLALCPPATLLADFALIATQEHSAILLGGQYCHHEVKGSFTGCISATMLKDAGASLTLVGHAERRAQGEDDATIALQLRAATDAALTPVLCIGERRTERAHRHEHLHRQLTQSLSGFQASRLIVAYEPLWAIGSGTTPSTEEIAAVARLVAEQTRSLVPTDTSVAVLYGGSVAPENAAAILAATDGVLVGSASLEANKLLAIVDASPA